ncbi:unnamed protein product [Caenorhabditis angaria]|uniref:Phosphatidylinositol 4-kinase beta n=1 Tax=Caenorhabditis angaria TaxID=860376 RepID=A0A9P1J668_9PELO|nr:unnamed protein product [Caenorhabditis angaria]
MDVKPISCHHSQTNGSSCSKCPINQIENLEVKLDEDSDGDVIVTKPDEDVKCIPVTPYEPSTSPETTSEPEPIVTKPLVDPPSWTMRLITSDRFSVPMAIEYLHTINDKPCLSYLGKRLFDLSASEIDFFLPQLIFMYVNKIDAASVTHAYIETRHTNNAHFTILCTWLLDCFIPPINSATRIPNHAFMLRGMLKSEIDKCEEAINLIADKKPPNVLSTLSLENLKETDWLAKKSSGENVVIGNGYGYDKKNQNEISVARELSSKELLNCEQKFIERLMQIGRKLMVIHIGDTKQEKMTALKIELQMLNGMLPAPVWIPFSNDHTILNICFNDSSVLNSKDKVPYILFVEVLRKQSNYQEEISVCRLESLEKQQEGRKCSPNKRIKMYHDVTDPSAAVFAESWNDKKDRIRACSDYGGYKEWDLIPVIVKYGDDLSQESFAQQVLQIFKDLWTEEGVPLYLRPYKIVCVGPDSGLVEPVLDTLSLHQIKRHLTRIFRENGNVATPTLRHHFEDMFGPPGSEAYVNAQKNFIQSTAAYSLVSYFLQLKDRHNGNILLDLEGHLIHIDYGFLLSSSPRNLGFETAPFKLTTELIDVMGGIDSDMFLYYKSLLLRGLMAARKHHRRIVSLAEIMSTGSKMQCFRAGAETVRALEARFHVSSTDEQLQHLVDTLVDGSRDSYTTRFYDSFQYYTNGIH